jgi:uncharacterized metal-binding protein
MGKRFQLPLVYSCSGCSNLAQLSNQVALNLDRTQQAEMSCIAGIGGNVKALVSIAKTGRPILTVDGCALACSQKCLAQHNITVDHCLILTDLGLKKRFHQNFELEQLFYAQFKAEQLLKPYQEQSNQTQPNQKQPKKKQADTCYKRLVNTMMPF